MENPPARKTARRNLGDRGEEIACQWYLERGYEIVDRNVNISRVGEIDVIASRENDFETEYVFIEVKTRSSAFLGEGHEAINYFKRLRMRNCAMSWIRNNLDRSKIRFSWRLDAVSVDVSTTLPRVRVFRNVEI